MMVATRQLVPDTLGLRHFGSLKRFRTVTTLWHQSHSVCDCYPTGDVIPFALSRPMWDLFNNNNNQMCIQCHMIVTAETLVAGWIGVW